MTNFLSKHSGWLWFAAFVCALFPINAFQLEFFAACMFFLFAWAYISLSGTLQAGWNLPRVGVLTFAGLFWLLVFASVFWSEVKSVSLVGLCYFSAMPLTFFVGVMTAKDNFFKKTGYALAIVFGVLAIWAMIQFFFLNKYFLGQARHPLGDPSSLGALFSIVFFCALGWLVSARPKIERICATILLTLLVCGVLSTAARGPVLGFLPAFILFCILLWPYVKAQWKSLLIVFMGGLLCYGLMQLDVVDKQYDMGKRLLDTLAINGADFSNNRFNIWSGAVNLIKDHLWFGTGIGTFFLYYPEYRPANEIAGAYMAHNDPLQFWAELGIMGPILFYAFAIAAVFRSVKALRKTTDGDAKNKILIVASFCALSAMVIESHVGFNHYNLSILMLTGFVLALWFHVTGRALAEPERKLELAESIPAGAGRALLALPFIFLAWMLASLTAGEYFVNKASQNLFQQKMFEFAEGINQANSVSQGMNFRAYLLAVNVPMSILEYNKNMMTDEQKQKLYDQVKGYMESLIALNPRMASSYYYLARVQGLVPASMIPEGTPTPEEYYKKALSLDPLFIGARMELVKLAAAKGATPKEQLAILEPGLDLLYTTTTVEAYYQLATQLYLMDENYGKAKEMLTKMYEFKKRSDFSLTRQNTSIFQELVGKDEVMPPSP